MVTTGIVKMDILSKISLPKLTRGKDVKTSSKKESS